MVVLSTFIICSPGAAPGCWGFLNRCGLQMVNKASDIQKKEEIEFCYQSCKLQTQNMPPQTSTHPGCHSAHLPFGLLECDSFANCKCLVSFKQSLAPIGIGEHAPAWTSTLRQFNPFFIFLLNTKSPVTQSIVVVVQTRECKPPTSMALVVSDITTACNEHLSKSTLTEFQNHPALFTVRRIAIFNISDGQGNQILFICSRFGSQN